MDSLFSLNIISPRAEVYSGKVLSLVVPCELGYLGVLANHRPLIASVKTGKITLIDDIGKVVNFGCKGRGFLEIQKNNVTIILHQRLTPLKS